MNVVRLWRELSRAQVGSLWVVLLWPPVLLVLMAGGVFGWQMLQQSAEQHQSTLLQTVTARAAAINARLESADAISGAWIPVEGSVTLAQLQSRVAASPAFEEIFSLPVPVAATSPTQVGAFSINRAQLANLAAGNSVLLPAADADATSQLYLLRQARVDGQMRILAFRLAADWWWDQTAPDGVLLSAVDSRGNTLAGDVPVLSLADLLPPLQLRQLQAVPLLANEAAGELHAATVALLPASNLRSPLLHVVASGRMISPWWSALVTLLGTLLLAAIATIATALLLAGRYLPWFDAITASLRAMASQSWAELRALPKLSELHLINGMMERAMAAQTRQWQSMQLQTQIHEVLLAAPELEPILEDVLLRLRQLMQARVLGVVLISPDMPQYGRLYVAQDDSTDHPVRRVSLDESMMKLLAVTPDGLTIMRYEPQRHSFLMPMTDSRAQLFWAWPVSEGDRLAGILVVGYEESVELDPQLAQRGTDSARRLGTVMSRGSIAERLYRQAHFDTLTQLPNRLLFRDRLSESIAATLSARTTGALLYVDLDHFKKINDTHGHAAGDHLLSIVAQRLRACVKDGDTVARLSGDEFTVILTQVTAPEAALAVAERILESLQTPVNLGGQEHQMHASIGVSLFPQDGTGVDELLRNADMAMYRAKDRGRSGIALFDNQMNDRNRRQQDIQLQSALSQREFSLYYQPQFSLGDGSLLAVEALLRWQSPRDGLRSPEDFVPAAEESGLIIDIGQWVLESACSQFALWRLQGLPQPLLSLNVSLQQLRSSAYASTLRKMLEKFAFDPARLEIELPISVFDDERSLASLQTLRRMNVRLALAGLDSIDARSTSLRRYPVQTVKLARQFVSAIEHDPELSQLSAQIIALSHVLGRRVVAEGVETINQLELLREQACDVVQGYYLARPLSVAGITELLSVRRPIVMQRGLATG